MFPLNKLAVRIFHGVIRELLHGAHRIGLEINIYLKLLILIFTRTF